MIRAKLALAPALTAMVAVVAGCGGGSGNAGTSSATEAAALQRQFVSVVKTASPSVVQIRTPTALGSGIVFNDRGDVVTNAHVVGSATRFVVTVMSGKQHAATLVGRSVGNDLAVIRLATGRPKAATFADSSKVNVGDIAIALGNPLGLRSSVTQGIVSAVGRSVSEVNGVHLKSVIQTSAEINPGNSGGALVDLSGRVIGIPTLSAVDPQMGGGQAPGIGFVIDSNTVSRIARGLASAQ